MKPSEAQHDFIEHMGRWWESGTGSRSAGRILGWLMICDPPHRSAPQLAEGLELSAGSISTQSRILEEIGFVERVTFPGDRVTYYRLKPDVWVQVMWSETDQLKRMREIAVVGSRVVPTERPERVEDMGLITQFFLDKWPSIMDELLVYLEKERMRHE